MIPKAAEDTITAIFKEELEKLGVKTEVFPVVATPAGIRKPDLLCTNGGSYPIEAKYTERDLIVAIAKVQNDYLKHHKVLGIKGGFAILYPAELSEPMPIEAVKDLALKARFKLIAMFPPEDVRPFRVYEDVLQQVAKSVAEHVLAPPKYVEPSIDYIIKSLRESALYILNGLKHLASTELEGFFGGKNVFKNILQYEEGKYPVEELKFAAAYLLVNQLLFYHAISRLRPGFPEIDADALLQSSDLKQYFEKVLDINYKVVFSYNVASLVPPKFSEEVRTIVNVIKGLSPEKIGGDLLGTIFHDLIPFEVRKNVAAFYTNVLAGELLALLSIRSHNDRVADFAVGSGGLLVASYRVKRNLMKDSFSETIHRKFVEDDLLGVDVMPFASNIAACHIALQSPQYLTDKVQLAVWDSTDLTPGRIIPSVAELKMVLGGQTFLESFTNPTPEAKGVVSPRGDKPEEIKLNMYDVIIMNPPFTRQERLPQTYKQILYERFTDYKNYLHGQMSYYCYFILLADRFLKEGGRMALVLPATVLGGKSTEGLRRIWTEKYQIEYVINTSERLAFSESTVFKEILLIARKTKPTKNLITKFTTMKQLPSNSSQAREMASTIRNSEKDTENGTLSIRTFDYDEIRNDVRNWFKYIALSDLRVAKKIIDILNSPKLTTFPSIGEALESDLRHYKYNDFHGFILNDEKRAERRIDVWFQDGLRAGKLKARHKEFDWKVEIPLRTLGRGLRRLSHVSNLDVSVNSDFLILDWFDSIKQMAKGLLTDEQLGKFNRSVVRVWRTRYDAKKAHVLLARRPYLSSPGTSVVAFYSDVLIVGINMWSIPGIEGEQAKILTLWLNSSFSIFQLLSVGITREGKWMTLHDYMIDELLVPNFEKLSQDEIKRLVEVFDNIGNLTLPSLIIQFKDRNKARMAIDKTWLGILGYEGDDSLLENLYDSLVNAIMVVKTEKEEDGVLSNR